MSDHLVVLMNGVRAGTLTRTTGGAGFDYDEMYRAEPDATPVSLSMPIQAARHRASTAIPWLWGLLPDNPEVLARWARQFQTTTSSPYALLATPVGEDCAGAVQFVRPERVDAVAGHIGRIDWMTEREVADRLAALRRDATMWLGPDFTGRFSLAGAQAKTALHLDGSRWGLPSDGAATTHILKPAIAGLDDHDLNEHLCLDAARRAGLPAARSEIKRFEDQTAVVVERYDRVIRRGAVNRVHQEDICQALAVPPSQKYEADGGPNVRAIAALLRTEITPVTARFDAVWSFSDALAWNWLIGGTDAHAKNYSVLLAGRQVRLAPLYDIASALAYPGVDELKLKMAMKLGDEYRLKAHRASTWTHTARALELDPEEVIERVRHLAETAPDAFATAAATPAVRGLGRPLAPRLVDAVASRAQRCRELLR